MEVATPTATEAMVHPWIEAMAILTATAVLIEDIPVTEAMVTGICRRIFTQTSLIRTLCHLECLIFLVIGNHFVDFLLQYTCIRTSETRNCFIEVPRCKENQFLSNPFGHV